MKLVLRAKCGAVKLLRRAKHGAARLGRPKHDAPSLGLPGQGSPIPAAAGSNGSVPASAFTVLPDTNLRTFFEPVMIAPSALGEIAVAPTTARRVMEVNSLLEWDDYVRYVRAYYTAGLERFGDAWRYADISTALLAAAQLSRPEKYLEIGVRRGHSLAMVASLCPTCEIVGFDMWMPDYAGMPNPGPEFVRGELQKVGFQGSLEFVNGNSHKTVPAYFEQHAGKFFDLITVDGDHTEEGAEQDLRDVLPHLKAGGVLVFDDIAQYPALYDVWQRVVASDLRFSTWAFTELGYGVAIAVRISA
jgi:predicted O-methyltransferase YrrM